MTLTIELPPEQEARLKEQAQAAGVDLASFIQRLLGQQLGDENFASIAHLQTENPEEWRRQFHEWVRSRPADRPAWDPATFDRGALYDDRA